MLSPAARDVKLGYTTTSPLRIMFAISVHYRLFLALFIVSVAQAAPGDFDRTFGQNGIYRLPNVLVNYEAANFVTTTADGKVLVTGDYITADSRGDILVRLTANGQLDPTFAGTGFGRSAYNPVSDTSGKAVFPLADGRSIQVQTRWGLICNTSPERVPCGPGQVSARNPTFYAQRFENNGALDPTYGIFGSATIGGEFDDVLADADGALTLVGRIVVPERRTQVLRYGGDGRLLPTNYFVNATNALSRCVPANPNATAYEMRALRAADGKLYVMQLNAFPQGILGTNTDSVCVARLQADGTLDAGWGNAGLSIISDPRILATFLSPATLTPRPDGGLLLVFNENNFCPAFSTACIIFSTSTTVILALTPAGAVDTSWGASGMLRIGKDVLAGKTVAIAQRDGKLLIAGSPDYFSSYPDMRARLLRLNINGDPDLAFGSSGKGYAFLESSGFRLNPMQLHIAGDGNIFIAGTAIPADTSSDNPAASSQFAVAKIFAFDPPPAPSNPEASGGGGCFGSTTRMPPDPTLPGLALLAALMLAMRHRPLSITKL